MTDVNNNKQSYANSHGTCDCPKTTATISASGIYFQDMGSIMGGGVAISGTLISSPTSCSSQIPSTQVTVTINHRDSYLTSASQYTSSVFNLTIPINGSYPFDELSYEISLNPSTFTCS